MIEKEDEYKFKFSVVIPIYNVENYLEETIKSVINQDIGFKENIQMILVNDGSPDNSEEICLKYKEMYPDNVTYIKQENSGVSAARNNGMKYIDGKYTNFLDSDDKWDLNVFSKVWDFFENNKSKIDVVSCRIKWFEGRTDYHILDYKFTADKIIDIHEHYNQIQLHIASSFIKTTKLLKYSFNENLKYAEDALFIGKIILRKGRIGLLKSAVYNYRKREEGTSAIDNSAKNEQWFLNADIYYKELLEETIKKYGFVIPYIQYQIMYDIQWKLKNNPLKILDDEKTRKYRNAIKNALNYIDDDIIVEQRNIFAEYKILALSIKHGTDIRKYFKIKNAKLYYNNLCINNLKSINLIKLEIMEIKDKKLILEGQVNCILPEEDYEIYIQIKNGEKYPIELSEIHTNDRDSIYGVILQNRYYKISLPLENINEFKVMLRYKKIYNIRLNINFSKFAKINKSIQESYYTNGKYIISQINNIVYIEKNKKGLHKNKEKKYLKALKKLKEYEIIGYRILYSICKKLIRKKVWIVSDRTYVAGDNGISMFKYLVKNERKAKVYFAIDSNSKDYKVAKKIGKVLKYNSIKYKLYFLLAEKIISSQADEIVINAFGNKRSLVKDLYNFKFVFLQHGIIMNDLSCWLHKFNKNISLFITSSKREYDSIVSLNYGYTSNEVKLTGLPRYDDLKDNREKQVTFMPTWRKKLTDKIDKITGERLYNPKFKDSEYLLFYNKLINDERIKRCLKDNGYIAKFCIHPALKQQILDFQPNEVIKVTTDINYQKEFEKSSLIITDYSSIFFDFAYLKKPIIYTQFDNDTFWEGQPYEKGYFNYETDGFGPVCYDYESTVKEIITSIQNNCRLDKKYETRINEFFEYYDKNNCKRVYEELLKLK